MRAARVRAAHVRVGARAQRVRNVRASASSHEPEGPLGAHANSQGNARKRARTLAGPGTRVRISCASRDVSGAEHLVRISLTGIGGFGPVRVMIEHHCEHEAHAEVNMADAAMHRDGGHYAA